MKAPCDKGLRSFRVRGRKMPQGAAAPRRYDDPMKAFVATCAIRVEIPWSTSLKEKRAPIRSLVDRFRHRHKTPLIRLHGAESHTWEVLGFTIIGSIESIRHGEFGHQRRNDLAQAALRVRRTAVQSIYNRA